MPRAPWILALPVLAATALVASDCALDPVCTEGTVGCAADACKDRLRDGDETDVDCGGSCGPCPSGASCAAAGDCASARCFEGRCCDAPCVVWARRYGEAADDELTSAVFLADGTLVVAGELHGTADFGGGPVTSAGLTDVVVAAYAQDGALRWLRRFGGAKDEFAARLGKGADGHLWLAGLFASASIDSGAGILHGSGGYQEIFLVELDAGGHSLRARSFGTQGTTVYFGDVVPTADGGVVLAGGLGRLDFGDGVVLVSTDGPFPGGPRDVFIAKLDSALARVWAVQLGDENIDDAFGVALDPAGDVVVGVKSETATSYGGPMLDTPPGVALVRLHGPDGGYLWARSYGANVGSLSLSLDADGSMFVAGDLTGEADLGTGKLLPKGTADALVARFGKDGTPTWVTQMPATVEAHGRAVLAGAGGVFAALQVTGAMDLGGGLAAPVTADGLVLTRLDGGGHVEWLRGEGGIVLGSPIGLTGAPGGRVLVYGGYAGTLALGALGASAGGSDAFVAQVLP